jgi:hypothetical protein
MPEKIIRDPVHDVIAFELGDPVDALIFRLIGATELQRLRRIRQLGLASLAYPGADHSRYSHSLGVFETARRIIARLERLIDIPVQRRVECLVAALLHDLGHGPFSHVFERVSGVHHEGFTRRLILDPESEVHQTLISFDMTLPERVERLLSCPDERDFICDILSSQLDADRLDYLLRDNLMTGARYGRYDLNWLLAAMTLDSDGRRLAVTWKGTSAVEAYLQARYHMYRHVYFHKVVRSAEGMVRLALQRARELIFSGHGGDVAGPALALPPGSGTVAKVLTGDRLSTAEFRDLDDVSVMGCFKAWSQSADGHLARLCRGLLDRRLYKTIDLSSHLDPLAAAQEARYAVVAAGGDGTYSMFHDNPTNDPYVAGDQGIFVVGPTGKTQDFADASPFVKGLEARLSFHRLHVAEEYRDAAMGAVAT